MKKLIIINLTVMLCTIVIFQSRTKVIKPIVDIARIAAQHVVMLSDYTGIGTGFYVKYKGKSYIISNKHVCGNAMGYMIDDKYHKVLALSTEVDLCLIESHCKTGLDISTGDLVAMDKVHVIGHPLGAPLTIRNGRYVGRYNENIIVSVAIFGGNSGSPVINQCGEVVAVIHSMSQVTEEDGIAVKKEDLIRFLNTHT